jgi:CRP-like cAMP-binding protein
MNSFRQFIENYTPISDKDWELIAACFQEKILEKEDILLEEGKICRHLWFVERGLLHFFIQKNGENSTKFFTEAPYCFTSQASFNAQKPATESIQAIEKSVIYQAHYDKIQELFELKSWTIFVRKITQEVQFFTEEILEELQTETAENRYEKMLKNEPELLLRIPLKYLASYLGIAPQSLSRIRKKMTLKERI